MRVKVGDKVQIGQTIATSGTSKIFPKGNNLHFEIIKANFWIFQLIF